MEYHPLFYVVIAASVMALAWFLSVLVLRLRIDLLQVQLLKLFQAGNFPRGRKLLLAAKGSLAGAILHEVAEKVAEAAEDGNEWMVAEAARNAFDRAHRRHYGRHLKRGTLPLIAGVGALIAAGGLLLTAVPMWQVAFGGSAIVFDALAIGIVMSELSSARSCFDAIRSPMVQSALAWAAEEHDDDD